MSSLIGVNLPKRMKALFEREKAATDTEELFRVLAVDLSDEEIRALSPSARAAVMTDRLHKSFAPVKNMLGRSPQALAARLAARGAAAGAEAFSGKEEIKEVVEKGVDAYEEYIGEIADIRGNVENPNPAETINGHPIGAGIPKDLLKRYQEINDTRKRIDPTGEIGKKLGEEVSKAAKKKALKEGKKVLGDVVAKGVGNLATQLHIRSTGTERFRDRRDEAASQEDVPEVKRGFSDLLSEQFVPGSRFADKEKPGFSFGMLATGRRRQR